MRAHLTELFPGRDVTEFSQFRVTRHSDLAVDEDDVRNLRTALRQGLQHRHYGQAVRLEVSASCSRFLSDFLQSQFALPDAALFRVHGPVNLVRLTQLVDLVNEPALLFPPWRAAWPRQVQAGAPLMEQIRRRDILVHQPFESFDSVLQFLREAVNDPQVLAIKQTIYRTGADSEMMELLREAVRRGKGSDGRRGTEGPLRRRGEHQLGGGAGVHRRPGGLWGGGTQDARQDAAGDPPRGQAAAPLRASLHGQLQPPHGTALHRPELFHGRCGHDGRHGCRVQPPGQPEQAAPGSGAW